MLFRSVSFFELGDVVRLAVGGARFPKPKHDADPFVSQSADGGLVFAAGVTFLLVLGGRPTASFAGVVGEFVEGLPEEFRTGVAATDVAGFSALPRHRSDAAVALDFLGGREAVAVGPEGGDQPRDERVARTGERAEDFLIGVCAVSAAICSSNSAMVLMTF